MYQLSRSIYSSPSFLTCFSHFFTLVESSRTSSQWLAKSEAVTRDRLLLPHEKGALFEIVSQNHLSHERGTMSVADINSHSCSFVIAVRLIVSCFVFMSPIITDSLLLSTLFMFCFGYITMFGTTEVPYSQDVTFFQSAFMERYFFFRLR